MTIVKYSTNPKITEDKTKAQAARYVRGWELQEVEWDENKLTDVVRTQSYIASKLKTGQKRKEDVIECYFIPLDFDEGDITIDAFKKKAKRWQFSWFLHTTSGHQLPRKEEGTGKDLSPIDKYRVWIPLNRPATRSELLAMKEYWMGLFPNLDGSCFQGERYFYLSPKAQTFIHTHKNELGDIVLAETDTILSKTTYLDKSKQKKAGGKAKKSVDVTFSDKDIVRLADGTERHIKDIADHSPIYCPFCIHDEEHRGNPEIANAFVNFNDLGNKYIYCSSEDKTYWQTGEEVNTRQTKLFLYTETGMPATLEKERHRKKYGYTEIYKVRSFENLHTDFPNWCMTENIDPACRFRLPRMGVLFDPSRPGGYLEDEKKFNLFQPTEYWLKSYPNESRIGRNKEVTTFLRDNTPYIAKVLFNIFGEDEYLIHFINWLACIIQSSQKKMDTAWLITSEVRGIGKDLMFLHILEPVFGAAHTQMLDSNRILDKFNSLDEVCILRAYNEVFQAGDPRRNIAIRDTLKGNITGHSITVEKKYVNSYINANYMNYILFSNSLHAILLDTGDRRFNVIRNVWAKQIRKEEWFKGNEHLEAALKSELSKFAELLHRLDYSLDQAREPLGNQAKEDLAELSLTEVDSFAAALKDGDVEYFLLDEVFDHKAVQGLTVPDDDIIGDISLYVQRFIKEYKAIPAKYMHTIVKHIFSAKNYRTTLKNLKFAGISQSTVRDAKGNNRTVRVYKHKDTIPSKEKN